MSCRPYARRGSPGLSSVRAREQLAQSQLADEVVRSIGSAAPQQPLRNFHGETAAGTRHHMGSVRPPDEVRAKLEEKAGAPLVAFWWDNPARPFGGFEPPRKLMGDTVNALLEADAPAAEPSPQPALPAPANPMDGMMAMMMQWMAQQGVAMPAVAPASQITPAPVQLGLSGLPRTGVRIADRVLPFLHYMESRKTSRANQADYAFVLRVFKELVGNLELADIGLREVDLFLDAMRVWPPNATGQRAYRHMKAPDVVRKARACHDTSIHPHTQQHHIKRLRQWFRWLEQRNEIRPGLLNGVRVGTVEAASVRNRHPFAPVQLEAIFTHPLMTQATEPEKFFLGMMGLYGGLRVAEGAQLWEADIVVRNGIWCFDIGACRPGQRLKNRQSARLIPIHSRILAAGFLDYVADVRAQGHKRLFPTILWGHNGPGDGPSDWFARFVRKHVGIDERGMTFHALRHTFVHYMQEANVSEWMAVQLLGHKLDATVMQAAYYKPSGVADKQKALESLPFPPLHHPVYQPGQFDRALRHAKAAHSRPQRLDRAYAGYTTPYGRVV